MTGIVLATTYAVLRFTVPAFEPPVGNCVGQGPVPETRVTWAWLDYRPEGDSTWVRTWKIGVQGAQGDTLVIGIPKDGPTWFRVVPVVDSTGASACSANEVLIP